MAIYHLSAQMISRSKGHSACAAAAYRSGTQLLDERTGEIHDYRGKQNVSYSKILAPEGAPEWVFERETLWNEVERVEKRKDSQLAREFEVAIPIELSRQGKIRLVDGFCGALAKNGLVSDMSIHHLDGSNPHAHILCVTRELTSDGFGKKLREWNSKQYLEAVRTVWANSCNRSLEVEGYIARVDHRSFKRQLSERTPMHGETQEQAEQRFSQIEYKIPQIHLGKRLYHMAKKAERLAEVNTDEAVFPDIDAKEICPELVKLEQQLDEADHYQRYLEIEKLNHEIVVTRAELEQTVEALDKVKQEAQQQPRFERASQEALNQIMTGSRKEGLLPVDRPPQKPLPAPVFPEYPQSGYGYRTIDLVVKAVREIHRDRRCSETTRETLKISLKNFIWEDISARSAPKYREIFNIAQRYLASVDHQEGGLEQKITSKAIEDLGSSPGIKF